ncbi:MAG: cytochrome P450 [Deltaproteobacteria bacterium]|nr:MAG: cytochrome P450 [Deltaproteobacteria bacterium]
MSTPDTRRPPGPASRLATTLAILRRPHQWYREKQERWGDTFTLKSANGDVLVTGDPELVRCIFALSEEQATSFATEAAVPVLGEHSVLTTTGEPHRRSRRLIMPAFSGDRLRALGSRMRAITLEQAEHWPQRGAFPVHEGLLDISLQIIVETVFGARTADEIRRASDHTARATHALHPTLLFSPLLQFGLLGLSPWDRFRKAREGFHDVLREIVAERRAGERGDDVLSTLLDARDDEGNPMADEELLQQLLALLVAGHETTSIAMTWAIHWLQRSPEALGRLHEELAAIEDVATHDMATLPWLGAVCRETLRLWPIVPDVLRTLKVPCDIGPWHLPAGHGVAAVPALTHYRPELYPEPDAFRPERFLDAHPRPWEWFPFGGGIRRCVGASFATFEMAQVLGVLFATLDFSLVDSGEVLPVRRNITLAPRGGVPVTCQLRARPR